MSDVNVAPPTKTWPAGWEEHLHRLGVPTTRLRITRQLAERILTALDDVTDEEIARDFGFGEFSRGLSVIAAMVAVEWVGTPSA